MFTITLRNAHTIKCQEIGTPDYGISLPWQIDLTLRNGKPITLAPGKIHELEIQAGDIASVVQTVAVYEADRA